MNMVISCLLPQPCLIEDKLPVGFMLKMESRRFQLGHGSSEYFLNYPTK